MSNTESESVAMTEPTTVADLIALLDLQRSDEALISGSVLTAPLAASSICVASSAQEFKEFIMVITANSGEELFEELRELLPQKRVFHFPNWETLPHERLSPQSDTVAQRYLTLRAIRRAECDLVVVPVRSLLQPFIKEFGKKDVPFFATGQKIDIDNAVRELLQLGYTRTDLVEKRGEFAQRGGIIDLFTPQALHPIRVEFFDDVIDEVRYFSVSDQRSLENCPDGLMALPAREILISDAIREKSRELAGKFPQLSDMFVRISEGVPVEGMESLMPALVDEMETIIEVIRNESLIISVAPELIRSRAEELIKTGEEFLEASWLNSAAGNVVPIDMKGLQNHSFRTLSDQFELASRKNCTLSAIAPFGGGADAVNLGIQAVEPFRGNSERLISFLKERSADQWSILLTTVGLGTAQRYEELLRAEGIPTSDLLQSGSVWITKSQFRHGYVIENRKFCLVTERDFAGSKTQDSERLTLASRRKNRIDPLSLKEGDFCRSSNPWHWTIPRND